MKKLRLGMVGYGRAGRGMHLKELEGKFDKFEIAAVCDVESERLEEVKEKFGCKVYSKIEEMVKDPDIDVIDIATRSCDHFKHAKTALEAGKIVFLEKPISCNYEDAKRLFEIAEKDGQKRLFIRHNRRFEPKFREINKIIDSGILGNVYLVKLARNSYNRRQDWQTLEQYGGGQLLNWGPHIIDHSLQFCGGSYKQMDAVLRQVAAAGDCEDFIKIIFTGENGRIVDMEISGGTALKTPEYVLYGTRGTLVDNGSAGTYTINHLPEDYVFSEIKANPDTPGATPDFGSKEVLPFVSEEKQWEIKDGMNWTWDYLYETVMNGAEYPIKSEEALKVMEVIGQIKKNVEIEKA